jgi:hypothetical protein
MVARMARSEESIPCPYCQKPISSIQMENHVIYKHTPGGIEEAKERGERHGRGRRKPKKQTISIW